METLEYKKEDNYFFSGKRDGVHFDTEQEVKLFNSLIDFCPNASTDKIIVTMKLVINLLGVNSRFKF